MAYTNSWEPNGLYRKFVGEVHGDEILESNLELQTHPNFSDIQYIINDFSEITGHSIAIHHTSAYAKVDDIVSVTKGQLKIAIIVTQDSMISLANSYREQLKNELFDCEIFDTVTSARNWISQP